MNKIDDEDIYDTVAQFRKDHPEPDFRQLKWMNKMNLSDLSKTVHAANAKWWHDIDSGERLTRNRGELLCLIHSEISEAMEGERKGLMDDKLPQYPMAAVEIIDAIIRSLDYLAGIYPDIDVQEVFDAKMAYNAIRKDHTHEARKQSGGKKF